MVVRSEGYDVGLEFGQLETPKTKRTKEKNKENKQKENDIGIDMLCYGRRYSFIIFLAALE